MLEIHKICSFFGHSSIEITDKLKVQLQEKLTQLIVNENIDCFFFGGFGMFDDLCYKIVSELKKGYPNISRVFCTADLRWLRPSKRPKWLNEEEYEEITYLDLKFDYWYTRIYYRNCEMIDQSDYVIFYVKDEENSGAFKAMQHAIKKKKQFINIYDLL